MPFHVLRARRAAELVAVAAMLATIPASPVTAAAPPRSTSVGALKQLAGKHGCVADQSRRSRHCAPARALSGVAPFVGSGAVAISPDGRSLYAASATSDAIAIFARNPRTGVLTQPAGAAGCMAAGGADGCTPAAGLDGASSVTVSADGRSVYAAARESGAVAVFTRDGATGALRQAADGTGCLAATPVSGCGVGRGLEGADAVAVSPDGRTVYVGAFSGNAVAVLTRDPTTGALTQPDGAGGCLTGTPVEGCATAPELLAAEGLVVSPDGTSVYVAAALSNALLTFARDAATGALTPAGCLAATPPPGCAAAHQLSGPNAVATSADGATVYATSVASNSLTTFTRDATNGALTQGAATNGCIAALPAAGCALARAFSAPEGLAVSPDGRSVYVASFAGALGVLARDASTGTVDQLRGRAGCLTATRTLGCTPARGLAGVSSVAVSPDGRYVYTAGFASSAIGVFRRATGTG